MNSHKCDMCGLYLIADGEACHECVKPVKRSNYSEVDKENEYKEESVYEYHL